MKELFKNYGVPIDIKTPENFLKIKETLTRRGICSRKNKKLWQTCHILHKRDVEGKSHYAILHFKELFKLDKRESNIDKIDLERRNRIAILLEEWGLVDIIDETLQSDEDLEANFAVISYSEKNDYELICKYHVGKRKDEK